MHLGVITTSSGKSVDIRTSKVRPVLVAACKRLSPGIGRHCQARGHIESIENIGSVERFAVRCGGRRPGQGSPHFGSVLLVFGLCPQARYKPSLEANK